MPTPPKANPTPDELIWIREAPDVYQRSREWFYQQLTAGELNQYEIAGTRRTYLLRAEVERLLAPRPVQRSDAPPPPAS